VQVQNYGSHEDEGSVLVDVLLTPNPALNLAPFSCWTLRDRAAQRRLALLQGLPQIRKCA